MNKSQKQPDPYRIDRLAKVPAPVKAVFIKWWFSGAVFFFIGMGLPGIHRTADNLDLVMVLGVVMGMVNDVLVNNIFRFMRTDRSIYDVYMVFPKKSLLSFFLNIIYYIAVSVAVYLLYSCINGAAVSFGWTTEEKVFLPVEPVGYGIGVLAADFAVLGVKALFRKLGQKKTDPK